MAGTHDAFIEAALPVPRDHRAGTTEQASRLAQAEPSIATSSIYAAVMLGELKTVESLLADDAATATRKGGPRNWDPLLYLCFSRYLRTDPERAKRMVRIAKLLLRHGADPNAHWIDSAEAEDARESVLYGAAGVANRPDLARLLIEAGADPNDGETPYHMVEHDGVPSADAIFPKLNPMSRGMALGHKTDYPDHAGMRKLLELGGDPNGPSPFDNKPLHQAVFRGRDKAFFDLLFEFGAEPNLRNGQGRTASALAARAGRSDIMGWLREQGASEELGGTDRFVAACALGEEEAVRDILASDPAVVESLDAKDRAQICEAAAAGNTAGVRTMLDAGWDVNTPGTVWKETALHRAAIEGHVETVELLVDRGADLTIRDRSYHSSPLGWADHGGKTRVLELLLRDPPKLDLRDAVEYGKIDRAIELLRDVDPNIALVGGEPGVLLRSAAHGGHLRLVEYLLDRGADPSVRNSEGDSPLDYARQQGHSEVAKLLERRSAD